jgi:hypothetical protein
MHKKECSVTACASPWRLVHGSCNLRRTTRPSVQAKSVSSDNSVSGTEQRTATRVRVERQTHLPACREEAWAVLRLLVPADNWKDISPVFAAMESIYRCMDAFSWSLISHL